MITPNRTDLETTFIPQHHSLYWEARKIAFRAVKMLERAIERIAEEPTYIFGGYNEHGDVIPVENIEPFDAVVTFEQMVANNLNAMAILIAQGKRDLIHSIRPRTSCNGPVASTPANDDTPFDDRPSRFCNYQCQNCDHVQSREQPPKTCMICGSDEFQPVN